MKTKRLVISILGMLSVTVAVAGVGGYTYFKSTSKKTVELVSVQKVKNAKELSMNQEETNKKEETPQKEEELPSSVKEEKIEVAPQVEEPVINEVVVSPIVYDGMTMEQLTAKLNRSLGSTLSGQGHAFAAYSLELGVDPYVAVAITLHETGCKWNCSRLVRECNNVGGMKGGPSCGGGAYKAFPTLDDGIRAFIVNLSNNYYKIGLTTPELMNSKYASSPTWAAKVNSYVSQIRAA